MYYISQERHGALWFAYIYREGDTPPTSPPVKEFHASDRSTALIEAEEWIQEKAYAAGAAKASLN